MYASLFPLPGPYSADGKMTWLLDLNGYSRKNSPPIRMALQTLHILQNHFPERLGLAVCYQTPLVFECEAGRGMVLITEWCRVLNRLRSLARSSLHPKRGMFSGTQSRFHPSPGMWRAVKAFVDPSTKKKLVFLHAKDPPGPWLLWWLLNGRKCTRDPRFGALAWAFGAAHLNVERLKCIIRGLGALLPKSSMPTVPTLSPQCLRGAPDVF